MIKEMNILMNKHNQISMTHVIPDKINTQIVLTNKKILKNTMTTFQVLKKKYRK